MLERMNFLELVETYMSMGLNESDACREAYRDMYPDKYEPEDYDY